MNDNWYRKKINKSEIEALSLLSLLEIQVFPEYYYDSYNLYTKKCTQNSDFSISLFLKVIELCNSSLYCYEFSDYSPGVYSFLGNSCLSINNKTYPEYLIYQLSELISKNLINIPYQKLKSLIIRLSPMLMNTKNVILHGDLHPGNVVLDKEKIYLIDFEYLRFGPKELEIAYFTTFYCLNFNSNFSKLNEIFAKIESLKICNMTTLKFIFFPLIVIFLLDALENKRVRNDVIKEEILIDLIINYYSKINFKL